MGGVLQLISNKKYKAIPYNVGRSLVIANNQGKILIKGYCDPAGQINLISGNKILEIHVNKMMYILLKGMRGDYQNCDDSNREKEIYQTFLSTLNEFPRPINNILYLL